MKNTIISSAVLFFLSKKAKRNKKGTFKRIVKRGDLLIFCKDTPRGATETFNVIPT